MPSDDFIPGSRADLHEAMLELRARAEKRRLLVTHATEHQSPEETQRLIQELQVHQIELEMQYEELLLAQAEAQLARDQYIDLYDFAPVGYFTLTEIGLIAQLNLCGSRQLGSVRQLLMGRRFALFVAPTNRMEFGQFLARVFSTDITQSCELMLQRQDGSPFYAQLEGLRVDATTAGPAGIQHCRLAVIDSTVRRQVTDALAASETRFRKLFAESHDAVVLLQGHTYVDCNAAALRMMGGYRREQLVGQYAWASAPELQPDGYRTVDLFRKSIEQALQTGSMRCEALMHKLTGEEIWVEAVLTPIEEEGRSPLVHMLWRDITAARLAAEQLRQSEARLTMALEASETGIFTWDILRQEVQWDERAQAAFGYVYNPAPVPVKVPGQRVHPDDAARVAVAMRHALNTLKPFVLDFRVVWPDGSEHHVSVAGRVLTDAHGPARRFVGVLRNVTALYAAQDELHYKTLVLERLLTNMPMILARIQPDGTYLEAVGAGLQALGLENDALVDRNSLEEFPALRDPLLKVLSGEQSRFLAELEVAGQLVALQNYGFFDAQRQQAVVLSVDVTEVEQQKKQLQAERDFTQSLLENSVDGIVAFDREGTITAWNSQASRYFGHEPAAALGRSIFEAIPSLDCDEAKEVVGRVLTGEHVLLEGQAFEHRAGQYDVYHVPLRSQGEGEITGILVLFRDVTERNRLAEEATQLRLRRQQEVLAAILTTQEMERRRIAEALHNGLGQLLYATKLSLETRATPATLPRQALKLLDEAIRTTRTLSFELTPSILEDFGLRTALEELVKRIARAKLPVRLHLTNLEKRLPPPVEIAVYRIVQELLNNVMKHARATEVEVHVAREGSHLEVSVEDNGRGFDPAALTAQPLAGIGLAGVRNRVALLGGELSINSQLSRGTIISFELSLLSD
ncbi:PAS domain S-box protein [Hymenobacter terrenus]|uniref:PAS domain S-box protein n=1 Tax=Hymenobacter terrenus TaxID=1629124 RepID=UPI0006192B12|nr:PAS domain S-box protein [Hymenobacter terrenus]